MDTYGVDPILSDLEADPERVKRAFDDRISEEADKLGTLEDVRALYAAKDSLWSGKVLQQLLSLREEHKLELEKVREEAQLHYETLFEAVTKRIECKGVLKDFFFTDLYDMYWDWQLGTNVTEYNMGEWIWHQLPLMAITVVPTILGKVLDEQIVHFARTKYNIHLHPLMLVSCTT